jgi:hypothetical protein
VCISVRLSVSAFFVEFSCDEMSDCIRVLELDAIFLELTKCDCLLFRVRICRFETMNASI